MHGRKCGGEREREEEREDRSRKPFMSRKGSPTRGGTLGVFKFHRDWGGNNHYSAKPERRPFLDTEGLQYSKILFEGIPPTKQDVVPWPPRFMYITVRKRMQKNYPFLYNP